jgi:hypothetical protein
MGELGEMLYQNEYPMNLILPNLKAFQFKPTSYEGIKETAAWFLTGQ